MVMLDIDKIKIPEPVVLDEAVLAEWQRAYKNGTGIAGISPHALFVDCTFLGRGAEGQVWKKAIEARCLKDRYFACIEEDPKTGDYIWHSFIYPTGVASRKLIADSFPAPRPTADVGETEYERAFATYLRSKGETVKSQVVCEAGRADIVTETKVYELKSSLNREVFFRAVGQVLLYRQHINPQAEPVIVAAKVERHLAYFTNVAQSLGITLMVWRPEPKKGEK